MNPPIPLSAKDRIQPIIREIAEPFRSSLEEFFLGHEKALVAEYREGVAAALARIDREKIRAKVLAHSSGERAEEWIKKKIADAEREATALHQVWPTSASRKGRGDYVKVGRMRKYLDPVEGSMSRGWRVVPDVEARMKAKAVEEAEMGISGFVRKATAKLQGIVEAKGNLMTVERRGGSLQQMGLRFEFSDGSGFLVRNSVVAATSPLGKFFFRYPTTFHDVTLAGGGKLSNPSEARVKAAFSTKA